MSASSPASSPRRARYADNPNPLERRLRELLLAQDGSTTRLCETVAGGPIEVQVLRQAVVTQVDPAVREHLAGREFIERVTALVAHGEVLMDALSYTDLDGLEPDIERDLRAGVLPIGHLLQRWWVRRTQIAPPGPLLERLWPFVSLPDPTAARAYVIVTPERPRMVIAEVWRAGMLMQRG